MKITIDKELTESYMMNRTKEQAKEFKAMYTDGDLLRMFNDAVEGDYIYGDILRCNLRAFPGGTMETDETHYNVEMVIEDVDEFIKVSFYVNQSGTVEINPVWVSFIGEWMQMYSVKRYTA